jgi:hypothetical protein
VESFQLPIQAKGRPAHHVDEEDLLVSGISRPCWKGIIDRHSEYEVCKFCTAGSRSLIDEGVWRARVRTALATFGAFRSAADHVSRGVFNRVSYSYLGLLSVPGSNIPIWGVEDQERCASKCESDIGSQLRTQWYRFEGCSNQPLDEMVFQKMSSESSSQSDRSVLYITAWSYRSSGLQELQEPLIARHRGTVLVEHSQRKALDTITSFLNATTSSCGQWIYMWSIILM